MTDTTKDSVTDALPERDTTKTAEQQGLFRKFDVRRVDGSDQLGGKHHGCRYYVLDVDHDPYAAAALGAYADACKESHPELARDLREKWGAANTIDTLRAQLAEAQSERDSLRKVIEFCKHKAAGMRVWGGMGWVYHPPQAKRIYEAAEAALAATKTGEQHDNFCT